jgi:hypothetical protein
MLLIEPQSVLKLVKKKIRKTGENYKIRKYWKYEYGSNARVSLLFITTYGF